MAGQPSHPASEAERCCRELAVARIARPSPFRAIVPVGRLRRLHHPPHVERRHGRGAAVVARPRHGAAAPRRARATEPAGAGRGAAPPDLVLRDGYGDGDVEQRPRLRHQAGAQGVVEILEFANSQLLEFRYYDQLLDGELARIYARPAERRLAAELARAALHARRPADHSLFIDVNELTDRAENALKIAGDVYVARLFAHDGGAHRPGPMEGQRARKAEDGRRHLPLRRRAHGHGPRRIARG